VRLFLCEDTSLHSSSSVNYNLEYIIKHITKDLILSIK